MINVTMNSKAVEPCFRRLFYLSPYGCKRKTGIIWYLWLNYMIPIFFYSDKSLPKSHFNKTGTSKRSRSWTFPSWHHRLYLFLKFRSVFRYRAWKNWQTPSIFPHLFSYICVGSHEIRWTGEGVFFYRTARLKFILN